MKILSLIIISILAAMGEIFNPDRPVRIRLANTYDAAVETHEATLTRTNDSAIATRHLLWAQGATDGAIDIADAATAALGTVDNIETETGKRQTLHLLGKGSTKKMVGAAAFAAGVVLYQAAGGKIDDSGSLAVGYALSASTADGDVVEVSDHQPMAIASA